jgi:hypothetical protein
MNRGPRPQLPWSVQVNRFVTSTIHQDAQLLCDHVENCHDQAAAVKADELTKTEHEVQIESGRNLIKASADRCWTLTYGSRRRH